MGFMVQEIDVEVNSRAFATGVGTADSTVPTTMVVIKACHTNAMVMVPTRTVRPMPLTALPIANLVVTHVVSTVLTTSTVVVAFALHTLAPVLVTTRTIVV